MVLTLDSSGRLLLNNFNVSSNVFTTPKYIFTNTGLSFYRFTLKENVYIITSRIIFKVFLLTKVQSCLFTGAVILVIQQNV